MARPQTASDAKVEAPKGKKMGELIPVKTDKPEYIQAEVLQHIVPFTIYGASIGKGRFGPTVRFLIAYKEDGGRIEKKVYTPTLNDDRQSLMYEVLKNKAITNCRLVQLPIGEMGYWKIIDADAPVPEVEGGQPVLSDDDIPF